MIIDCDTCEVRGKECGDCVVTFLSIPVRGHEPAPLEMDDAQAAAVSALAGGGLVPPLRLVRGNKAS
jgi:hypothetical protein